MIPFSHTWPYERIGDDLFFHHCPDCRASHVLLPIRASELEAIRTGEKRLLVLPCCHKSLKIVDADADYLLADKPVRPN